MVHFSIIDSPFTIYMNPNKLLYLLHGNGKVNFLLKQWPVYVNLAMSVLTLQDGMITFLQVRDSTR